MNEQRLPESAVDLSGQRFGDYLILRRLGSGGMADVYLAVQESLDRQVAIKVLKRELAEDENYVRRFHNEAKSVAALTHQNIVQVFEVGEAKNRHYIVQEYIAGRNLKQHLNRTPSLEVDEAMSILRAVTSALARSASLGIVHRDIKPENILLGDRGEVKVADFGLARKGRDHQALELTQIGMTVGTPLYMSPEQIRGGKLDALTDMYSLGVTAYQMLAGQPPFDADTPLNVAMKHVNEHAALLSDVRGDVPVELAKIIARMMAKEPSQRFSSFDDLAAALNQIDLAQAHAGLQDRANARSGQSRPLSPSARELSAATGKRLTVKNRKRWVWLAAAAFLGALLAVWGSRADPLALRPGEVLPRIERKETASAQYSYALFLNTEEGWQAVLDYYPEEGENGGPRQRYYALLAKRQLARWYFENDRFHDALPICVELAALDATDKSAKAFGLAGQAIAYFRMGERDKAASMLSSLEPYRDIIDQRMRRELTRIGRALRND